MLPSPSPVPTSWMQPQQPNAGSSHPTSVLVPIVSMTMVLLLDRLDGLAPCCVRCSAMTLAAAAWLPSSHSSSTVRSAHHSYVKLFVLLVSFQFPRAPLV